jgi:hypothetical protein
MHPMRNLFTKVLCPLMIASALVLQPVQGQPLPMENPGLDVMVPGAVQISSDTVIFSAFGRDYTAGELTNIIRYNPPTMLGRINAIDFSLDDVKPETIKEVVMEYAINKAAQQRTAELGIELGDREKEFLKNQNDRMKQLIWLENKGILNPMTISEEEIVAEYEAIKSPGLERDEILELRHVFLSTYEEYEVLEGDSLESIAQKVNGDGATAAQILAFEMPRRPRGEATKDESGTEMPAKALVPGEKLLVPMNAEKKAAVQAKIIEAHSRLIQGEDFAEVAGEFAENSSKAAPVKLMPEKNERPLLPEFVDAFHKLKDGEFSEPFETKHGFQILQRVSYQEKGFQPMEEVRDEVRNRVETTKRNEIYQELINNLWLEYQEIPVDMELLAVAELEENADKTILSVGDVLYTGAQFATNFAKELTPETTLEDRRAMLSRIPMVARAITTWDIERSNAGESPLLEERLQLVEAPFHFEKFLTYNKETAHPFSPTEDEFLVQYETVKAEIENLPVAEAWQITVSADPTADQTTEEGKAKIEKQVEDLARKFSAELKTKEQFMAMAKVMSEDELADKGGYIGSVSQFFLDGIGNIFLVDGRANTMYGPILRGDKILTFWIGEKRELPDPSLEDLRDYLRGQLQAKHEAEVQELTRKELIKVAGLELKGPLAEIK